MQQYDRRRDPSAEMAELVLGLIGTTIVAVGAAILYLVSRGSLRVRDTYLSHGRGPYQFLLMLLAIAYAIAVMSAAVAALVGAWAVGLLIAGSASVAFVLVCWGADALLATASMSRIEDENLQTSLGDPRSWWRE